MLIFGGMDWILFFSGLSLGVFIDFLNALPLAWCTCVLLGQGLDKSNRPINPLATNSLLSMSREGQVFIFLLGQAQQMPPTVLAENNLCRSKPVSAKTVCIRHHNS